MFDFFYQEFKSLKALTGFTQWEKLNEMPDPENAIREVINPMVQITQVEPFKKVKPDVLQRVIHNAILTDKEFTGLNAKFVLKALNAWWATYGDKILQAIEQKGPEVYEKVKLDPEADARVNYMLKSFQRSIESGVFQQVPKSKDPEKEGAEWVSGIERKSVIKEIDPDRKVYSLEDLKKRNEQIRAMQEQAFRSRNPGATDEEVALFMHTAKRYELKLPEA